MIFTAIKTIGGAIAGGAVGYVAECAIKTVQPVALKGVKKMMFKLGAGVIGGIAMDAGSRYIYNMVDEAKDLPSMFSPKPDDGRDEDGILKTIEHGDSYYTLKEKIPNGDGFRCVYEFAAQKYSGPVDLEE